MTSLYGDGDYGEGLYGGGPLIDVVFALDGSNIPGYQISVSDLSLIGGSSYWTVTRRSTTAYGTSPVRGMDKIPLTEDSATQTDHEFSFLEDYYYEIRVYDINNNVLAQNDSPTFSGRDAVAAILAAEGSSWPQVLIRSTHTPELNQLCSISEFSQWTITGRVLGQWEVLGRANPVVLTDKSGGRTGSFVVLITDTNGIDPQEKLEILLTSADTLLFQCLYFDPRFRDMFFKVSEISVERLSLAGFSETGLASMENAVLQVTVGFIEVDRPSTEGETFALLTWQDVLDNYATWQDVMDGNSKWLDVLNKPTGG